MKLVCSQSDLSTNLSLVSRAVPTRVTTHPILANVLMSASFEAQQVSLTGFDLSLGIRTSFKATVETGGEITLPAKLLSDIVSRLPGGEIVLEDEADTASLQTTITSTSGRYRVRGMGVEEFPELPVVEEGEAIYLPVEALIEGLRGSLFATSNDETKQVLTGLRLTIGQDTLEFAATDGHRLAVVETTNHEVGSREDKVEVTVPAKALRELERVVAMRKSTEPLALHFEQGQVVFEWADQCLTSRTIEGQYPDYRRLIPHQFSLQVTLDRRQLLSALERIAVLADQNTNSIVKFSIDSAEQELALSVEAIDVGSGREVLSAQISGDSIEVAFNVKYLMEGIKALSTSEIQMQLNTATSPVILTPLGSLKMTYLIMPVQIRS